MEKNIGNDKALAIAIPREYNNIMRPLLNISINSLIQESGGKFGERFPFSKHMEHLFKRIVKDETSSITTLADWQNDIEE